MEEESKTKFSMNVEFSFAFKNFKGTFQWNLAKSHQNEYNRNGYDSCRMT